MKHLILPSMSVPPELAKWLRQTEGQPLLVAIEQDQNEGLIMQPLAGVDPQVVYRVLKSMAQYEEVLRRLA